MCHCGNTGMERTPNKSQHTELTLEKIILMPLQHFFSPRGDVPTDHCYRVRFWLGLVSKEAHTAVVWSCFPFIRSGRNHLARHSERGKKTRRTKEEVGRQHQGNGQAWSSTSLRGQWRTGKNEENWLQKHLWCPNDPRG